MQYKIIQIIPVSKPMYTVFRDEQGETKLPIVALALVEYENGLQEILPVDVTPGKFGEISVAAESDESGIWIEFD